MSPNVPERYAYTCIPVYAFTYISGLLNGGGGWDSKFVHQKHGGGDPSVLDANYPPN